MADYPSQTVACCDWPKRLHIVVHETVQKYVGHAADDTSDKRLTTQASPWRGGRPPQPTTTAGYGSVKNAGNNVYHDAGDDPHANAAHIGVEIAVDWRIMPPEIEQDLGIDEDVGCDKRSEPEPTRNARFGEKAGTEMKRCVGNRQCSLARWVIC